MRGCTDRGIPAHGLLSFCYPTTKYGGRKDKVRPNHLERKALLYVRQSSAHQVLHNRESSALQYAMQTA